jgi:drug/metabolite transporter (DMT)-like permease
VYKRAFAEGAGVVHALVINNLALGILFLPLLAFSSEPLRWSEMHLPVLTAAAFVIGHWLNVLALRAGDVSVATPLLGAKVIFVALVGWWVFGIHLNALQWFAAALTTIGVGVMGWTDRHTGRRIGLTTVTALGSAAAFALTDVMIQAWGGRVGVMNFLPLQFAALAAFSSATFPFFGVRSLRAPPSAWKWIAVGGALSAAQAVNITLTIAIWRDAAGVNVMYATRGLWSIALVWLAGPYLGNTERHTAGGRQMIQRFAGATLILVSVVLIILHGA